VEGESLTDRGDSEEDEVDDEEKQDEVEEVVEVVEEVLLLLDAHTRQGHRDDRAITAPRSTHPTCQALARGRHPQRSIANTRWCVLCNRG
jgi:hypothetical protein